MISVRTGELGGNCVRKEKIIGVDLICMPLKTIIFLSFLIFSTFVLRSQNDSSLNYHFVYVSGSYTNCLEPTKKYYGQVGYSLGFEYGKTNLKNWSIESGLEFSLMKFRTPTYDGLPEINCYGGSACYGYVQPTTKISVYKQYFLYGFNFPLLFGKKWTVDNARYFFSAGPNLKFGILGHDYEDRVKYYDSKMLFEYTDNIIARIGVQSKLGMNLPLGPQQEIMFAIFGNYFFQSHSYSIYTQKKSLYSFGIQASFPFNATRQTRSKNLKVSEKQTLRKYYNDSIPEKLKMPKHCLYLEILGSGGIGSINFEGMIHHSFNCNRSIMARVGIGYVDAPVIILGPEFLFGKNHLKFETGAGLGITAPFYDSYIHTTIGLRYEGAKGFLFRATFTPLLERYNIVPFGGISIGLTQ
jgi:hypothetical protein